MAAYSFQKQFEAPIQQGFKTHTIRAVGKRRHARVGERMQLYVGMRTKQCRLILEATCTGVSPIRLSFYGSTLGEVSIAGRVFTDVDGFAISDGFKDAEDMGRFWAKTHNMTKGDFEGLLIEWAVLPDGAQE